MLPQTEFEAEAGGETLNNLCHSYCDDIHVRRDPVDDAVKKSAKLGGGVESNRASSNPEPFQGITTDKLKSKWKAAVAELSNKGVNVMNADHALEGALSIR